MELDPVTVRQFAEAVKGLDKTINDLRDTLHPPAHAEPKTEVNGTSKVIINAGGIGLWIAVWFSTLACAVMLTITFLSRNDLIDQSRRLDLANDKLSIILQWAPQLKDIVDKQISQQDKKEK